MEQDLNGERNEYSECICPLEGTQKIDDLKMIVDSAYETHKMLQTLVSYTAHLPEIAQSNQEIKHYLMSAATGRNHVPLAIVERVVKMGGWVIFGLTAVIVFLLTGQEAGWIHLLR